METTESLQKGQINTFSDFGRILFAFAMSTAGAFLLGMLTFHLAGIKSNTSELIKVLLGIPFSLIAFFLGIGLLKVFTRFRTKCGNERDFWMIMLSFSLAGMFIMPVRKLIFHLLGITAKTAIWIKILVYIPIVPPAYYAGLLVIGTLLGQSSFFLEMIQKRLKFLTGRKNIKH